MTKHHELSSSDKHFTPSQLLGQRPEPETPVYIWLLLHVRSLHLTLSWTAGNIWCSLISNPISKASTITTICHSLNSSILGEHYSLWTRGHPQWLYPTEMYFPCPCLQASSYSELQGIRTSAQGEDQHVSTLNRGSHNLNHSLGETYLPVSIEEV